MIPRIIKMRPHLNPGSPRLASVALLGAMIPMPTPPRPEEERPYYAQKAGGALRCKKCHGYWPDKCRCAKATNTEARNAATKTNQHPTPNE